MMRVPLQAALDAAQERARAAETPRDYLGASWIGSECERAVWYEHRGASEPDFSGRILRRFGQGHATEAGLLAELRSAGYEVISETPRGGQLSCWWRGGLLRGHIDGLIRGCDHAGLCDLGDTWHLFESKIIASARYHYDPEDYTYSTPLGNRHPTDHPTRYGNPSSVVGKFWQYKKKGVAKISKQYYAQMQTYMGMSRELDERGRAHYERWGIDAPLDRALFVGVNGDTAQVHSELVEYEPRWWAAARGRAMRVARASSPPERVAQTAAFPPCAFCSHRSHCHGSDAMRVNCRTCVHAELQIPGTPGYYGRWVQWTCRRHGHGCGDYTACSDYTPITEVPQWGTWENSSGE